MYGIIYKTTYLPTGEWYVGKHKCDSEEFDGYLGSGKIIKDFKRTHAAENFERITLAIAETENDLNNLEVFYIESLGCLNDPHCWNVAKGGDGGIVSDYWYGPNSESHKRKASEEGKKYWASEEGAKKKIAISEKLRGNDNSKDYRKSVVCEETKIVYEYAKIASDILGINEGCIKKACNGLQQTAGGFHWYFLDVSEDELILLKNFWNKPNGNSKNIECVETGIIYNSAEDAFRITGISHANINKVCNGKRKTAGGFHWRYAEDGGDQ